MSLIFDRGAPTPGRFWKCDSCGVTTLAILGSAPIGWDRDDYPGGHHHYCPECLIVNGIDVGTPDRWGRAWEELG